MTTSPTNKDVSSDESEEDQDKITTVTATESVTQATASDPPAPVDELEFQLAAEQREKDKVSAGHYYTDPADGTCYEWDESRRAWVPYITEDWLARYQMSYGVDATATDATVATTDATSDAAATDATSDATESEVTTDAMVTEVTPKSDAASIKPDSQPSSETTVEPGAKKQKKGPEWFSLEDDKNTWVYVSGLPLDMTSDGFLELLGKYGLIMEDPESEKKKYKMYTDEEGNFKGDAKCCYLKKESIPLATQMLNGTRMAGSSGKKIKIEQAKFQMKGEFNPKLKPKKKNNKKKKNKKQENLLGWRDRAGGTDLRPKHAKIVIMKYCFDPKEFLEDATMITEIRDDIKEECEKIGPVKKVLLFDRHPHGIVSVKFGIHESAEDAVKAFDKRWFGGKQLEAWLWDGITDYAIEETAMERDARLASWHNFLGDDDEKTGDKADKAKPNRTVVSNKVIEASTDSNKDEIKEEIKEEIKAIGGNAKDIEMS